MRWINAAIVMAMFGLAGGCATIVRGTHQTVRVSTDPEAAAINVDGKMFQSPADVDLARRQTHIVIITKDGYRPIRFELEPQWDGMSLVGNMILPGGSVGFVADSSNGADKAFFQLAEIKLVPSTQPAEPALVLKDYKGHLLSEDQFAAAVLADRNDRAQFFRGEP